MTPHTNTYPSTPPKSRPQTLPQDFIPHRQITHAPDDNVERSQETSLNQAGYELKYCVWEDAGIIDHFCPDIIDTDIDKVVAQLDIKSRPYGNWLEWNIGAGQEGDACSPLACFQNQFIQAINTVFGFDEDCIFGHVEFHVWNKPMKEGQLLDNTGDLKPGLIIHEGKPPATLSWLDVPLTEEVNTSWAEMIRQVSTYTRRIFASHENWNCVPTIMFNQVSGVFRFGFQNRTGLVLTPEMSLFDQTQFRQLMKAFTCLTKWTPERALIGMSHSRRWFSFEHLGKYGVRDTLAYRSTLIGTCSRVWGLVDRNPDQPLIAQPETAAHGIRPTGLSLPLVLNSRNNNPRLRSEVVPSQNTKRPKTRSSESSDIATGIAALKTKSMSEGVSNPRLTYNESLRTLVMPQTAVILAKANEWSLVHRMDSENDVLEPLPLPDLPFSDRERHPYIVYKLSWPIVNHSTEGAMFKDVRGEWGVPYVLDAFEVKDRSGRCIETDRLRSDEATFCNILLSGEEKLDLPKSVRPRYVNRRLYGVLMKTAGRPLKDAKTLGEMLRGVLHGMLGHYVLYSRGWLHRDVSTGNILLLNTPEDRKQQSLKDVLPANVSLGKCIGMIIDGDHAVKWAEDRDLSTDSRSGTLPFISTRLISAWRGGSQVLHTVIDDLESFFWVLLVSLLQRASIRPLGLSSDEQHVYTSLHSADLAQLSTMKVACLPYITTGVRRHRDAWSPAIHAILPLLRKWHTLMQHYEEEVDKLCDPNGSVNLFDVLCREAYKQYLDEGFKALETIENLAVQPSW